MQAATGTVQKVHTVDTFKADVKEAAKNLTLHQKNWKAPEWKALSYGVQNSQDVLEDAFKQQPRVQRIFTSLGVESQRTCKSLARLPKKLAEVEERGGEYFKVVSDFVAARIPCQVTEIRDRIERLREIVLFRGGVLHVRGESDTKPFGAHLDGAEYKDIVQFAYVYLDEVGYPIELQIGHPFAFHTFTIDSARRDNEACGLTDLWQNDFYTLVKKYLLAHANNQPLPAESEIRERAITIHREGVPEELRRVLDNLFLSCRLQEVLLQKQRGEKEPLGRFLLNTPHLDVARHKDLLLEFLKKYFHPELYYVAGEVDFFSHVNYGAMIEEYPKTAESEAKRKFYQTLLPLTPRTAVAVEPTLEIFLRAQTRSCPALTPRAMSCDEAIKFACQLGPKLEKLDFTWFGGYISLDSLKRLVKECPNIRAINLSEDRLKPTDERTRLDYRNLEKADEEGLLEILKLEKLEELKVVGSRCSDKVIEAMKRLKRVDIERGYFGSKAAEILAQSTTLEMLRIPGHIVSYGTKHYITDAGLDHLSKCSSLKQLDISSQDYLTTEAVERFMQANPHVKVVGPK